jgi:hypothetical protein
MIEKNKFDNFQMSLHVLSAQNGLTIGTKCDIFNRLQNGEKVSSYDKLKNLHTNPITSIIRSHKLLTWLNEINFINKVAFTARKTTIKHAESFNIYFLIRTFLIIDKKTLETNYLDINIKKYLEANNGSGNLSVRLNTDIRDLIPKVIEILEWIAKNDEIIQSIPELLYIYVCIYANYGLKKNDQIIKWLSDPNQLKQLNKLNDPLSYKKGFDKVVSAHNIIKYYDMLCLIVLKIKNTSEVITNSI